jgi:hypothetical protein
LKRFTILIINCRLSLKASNDDIFNKWHGCYHGTSPENIAKIVDIGRLLKPGIIVNVMVIPVVTCYYS